MLGNWPVPFGKGPTEQDSNQEHLAGGLLHSEGARGCDSPGPPDSRVSRPPKAWRLVGLRALDFG
jgi:hypothetical protein